MKLMPLTDRVVLKQLEAEETTKSGIILTGTAQEKPQEAEVIAVGPGGMVDGKEVTMDADKGTKVAYAEISYSGVVTGDITYTTANQAAYADAKLVAKDSYFFTNQDQSAKVENDTPATGIAGTITVNLKNGTVSAGDLVTLLNKEAKANENQTIAGVYNTQDVESSKVAADANLAGDMLVKVVAWDNKTVAYYRIAVTNAPTV